MNEIDEMKERFQACVDQFGALTELLTSKNDAGIVLQALTVVTAGLISCAPDELQEELIETSINELVRLLNREED